MSSRVPFASHLTASRRISAISWVMVLTIGLLLQGFAAGMARVSGPAHIHLDVAADSLGVSRMRVERVYGTEEPVEQDQGHEHEHEHDHDHEHERHQSVERHSHDADNRSVVWLDGERGQDDADAGLAHKRMVIDLDQLPTATSMEMEPLWRPTPNSPLTPVFRSRAVQPLERPPR